MKKVLLILMCCMAIQSVHAQDTPKWADKAKKAVFSIVTYDKENKIKNTGNGRRRTCRHYQRRWQRTAGNTHCRCKFNV